MQDSGPAFVPDLTKLGRLLNKFSISRTTARCGLEISIMNM